MANARLFVGLSMLFIGFTTFAHAGPGSLDATFGSGGVVLTRFDEVAGSDDEVQALAIQADGKIVVVGSTNTTGGINVNFALARYNTDGSLDTAFGVGGKVVTDFGRSYDFADAVVIQPDGKIVAVGSSADYPPLRFAIARYNSDGSLDASFGSGGKVDIDLGIDVLAESVALQSDGKILVGGGTFPSPGDFALARYDATGALDTSFGTAGLATTDFDGGPDMIEGLALHSDGQIVAVGQSTGRFALAVYKTSGNLNPIFGSGGIAGTVTTPIGGYSSAEAVRIQPDAKILVAGWDGGGGPGSHFILARYDATGTLDPSFGSGGVASTNFSSGSGDLARELALQADGSVVVIGDIDLGGDSSNDDFGVARYLPNGTLDPSFGVAGLVSTPISSSSTEPMDEPLAIALQNDGKIVVVGTSAGVDIYDDFFAVVRYIGNVADLSVDKTASKDSVKVGDTVTFSVTVTNHGPDAAGGVKLVDVIPTLLTLEGSQPASLTVSQGQCTGTTTLTCDLGTIANGATATINYSATAHSTGKLVFDTSVSGQVSDTLSSNNVVDPSSGGGEVQSPSAGGCSLTRD